MDEKNGNYRADIDGLRAIAVVSVVLYHAFPDRFKSGFIGVDIFFVISGYLITQILQNKAISGAGDILEFYKRRIRRIFPALIAVMTFFLITGWLYLLPNEYLQLGKHTFAGGAFILNFLLYSEQGYFDTAIQSKPMMHLWSLAIEEQFYVIWPLLLAIVSRLKSHRIFAIFTITLASFSANIYLASVDSAGAFLWPITRFWELLAGGMLAHYQKHRYKPQENKYGNIKSAVGILLISIGFVFISDHNGFPGYWALLPVLGACFIIDAGPFNWINSNILSSRPVVKIGLISYPLYLWHWPLLSFSFILEGGYASRTERIAIVAASIILAWITYTKIEKPIREAKSLFTFTLVSGLIGTILLSGAIVYHLGFTGRDVIGINRHPPSQSQTNRNAHLTYEPCNLEQLSSDLGSICVTRANQNLPKQVIVWGDSQSGTLASTLVKAAIDGEYGVTVLSNPGCPPIIGVRQTAGLTDISQCHSLDRNEKILNAIIDLKPSVIVLIARWDLYLHGFTRNGRIEKTNHFLTTSTNTPANTTSTLNALTHQIPATINKILSKGVLPIVLLNPPILKGNINNYRIDVAVTATEHYQYQEKVHQILTKNSINYIDLASVLCTEKFCRTYDESGRAIYLDDNHLSQDGALLMLPLIQSKLQSMTNRTN